jgi:repressor LexA
VNNLTKRQKEILEFIKKYTNKKGYPPTVREIGKELGLSSTATIHSHLKRLENMGVIKREKEKNRAIEILDEKTKKSIDGLVTVPLLGMITAGNPIEAIQNPAEFFTLPAELIPRNSEVFTLRVKGDSMKDIEICDGDIVIVKVQNTANNGDIVAAMTDDYEVTLKTFYKEKDYIRLQPQNKDYKPIITKNITILGKVVGLYRKI